jgi:3-oxoacyl-[acyl-carrier-protein] synthase III
MTDYQIEFWRGNERVSDLDYETDEFRSLEAAQQHIHALLHAMLSDPWAEDWTGCRFEVRRAGGKSVLEVPVLAAMSAIARRKLH